MSNLTNLYNSLGIILLILHIRCLLLSPVPVWAMRHT